ncbi:hypothetical protein XELAEV_18000007mg [Xenopus laevis]|uniref:Uncharacterized protein n=1 Tax=Xenopus laevis TaxID=8355 RepID=A0A974BP45_XENLA|nr:hypothetical protein XELAEV_18000007mg [Xenopus laevis]
MSDTSSQQMKPMLGQWEDVIGLVTTEITALGRPFSLGSLYNCHNDQLIPGNKQGKVSQHSGLGSIS